MDTAGVRFWTDRANPWTMGRSAISATGPPSKETPLVGTGTKLGHGAIWQVIVETLPDRSEIKSASLATLLGCTRSGGRPTRQRRRPARRSCR